MKAEHKFEPAGENMWQCFCGCKKRLKNGGIRYNKSGNKLWLKVAPGCRRKVIRVHPYMISSNWTKINGRAVFKPAMENVNTTKNERKTTKRTWHPEGF